MYGVLLFQLMVVKMDVPITAKIQATTLAGRYLLVIVMTIPPTIANGAITNADPKRSTPD